MVLAFDLDGTISDAALGITSSINYALEKMGHPARDPASLNIYIGPPLQDIFGGLLNTEEAAVVRAAVTFFRERYFSVGYKENVLYPGMMDVIRELITERPYHVYRHSQDGLNCRRYRYYMVFIESQPFVANIIQLVVHDRCADNQDSRNGELYHDQGFSEYGMPPPVFTDSFNTAPGWKPERKNAG